MFDNAIISGVPLLFVVFGLVAWLKSLGVKGQWLTVASLFHGLLLGIAYQYSQAPLLTFAAWFGAVVYGLGLGITASGVYKGLENATGKTDLTEIQSFTSEISTTDDDLRERIEQVVRNMRAE